VAAELEKAVPIRRITDRKAREILTGGREALIIKH